MGHAFYRRYGKRLLDVVVAVTALVVSLPLQASVAAFVLAVLGWPILFRQTRPGWRASPFEIVKFRTMSIARDLGAGSTDDEARLGWAGRCLRTLSLDELPELWNVVKGDMSLVGPRPLLMNYVTRYQPWQARRHEVRPGVTGWAQVNGRNALTWDEKFRLDVWYVDHMSFRLDVRILFLTIVKVVRREGISAAGSATMPEFRGEDP